MNEMEILRKAYDRENDIRDRRPPGSRSWEFYTIGATRADIRRLVDDSMVCVAVKGEGFTRYKLTDKANKLIWALTMEHEFEKVPASSVLEAMDLVVGFEDIKITLAQAIASRRRTNFLLEGPPACAKSIMLEGVRSAVPGAYLAFGSRTSASGLSDALFENHPYVLLLDEADKMDNDVYSVLLGLMESGEVIETKSRRSRGLKLETMVIAACNSSERMPRGLPRLSGQGRELPSRAGGDDREIGLRPRARGCAQGSRRLAADDGAHGGGGGPCCRADAEIQPETGLAT